MHTSCDFAKFILGLCTIDDDHEGLDFGGKKKKKKRKKGNLLILIKKDYIASSATEVS